MGQFQGRVNAVLPGSENRPPNGNQGALFAFQQFGHPLGKRTGCLDDPLVLQTMHEHPGRAVMREAGPDRQTSGKALPPGRDEPMPAGIAERSASSFQTHQADHGGKDTGSSRQNLVT
jgi:hypothetical protein